MSTPLKHESRHIAKKIILGVTTAVCTSAAIYFLGFNRSPAKASEVEIKKITIKAWKDYVKLENAEQPRYDTSLARVRREAITMDGYYQMNTDIYKEFRAKFEAIKATEDIDREFYLLLDQRIKNKDMEYTGFQKYFRTFRSILDSTTITNGQKSYLISELNTELNGRRNNFIERVGRSVEDISSSLTRKYKYPFSIKDFTFNTYYQTLKEAKQEQNRKLKEMPAPTDPSGQ